MSPRRVVRTVLIVGAVLAALYLVYRLRQPLTWIFLGLFLALAVSGPIAFLRRFLPPGLAILVVYLGLVIVPLALGALLVVPLVREVTALAGNLPAYAVEVREFVSGNETLRNLNENFNLTGRLQSLAESLPGRLGGAASTLTSIGSGIVSGVFTVVTILILSLFILGGGPRWLRWVQGRQDDPRRAARIEHGGNAIAGAVGGYVGGALAQATVAGVTAWIVLLILGVPYASALALLVALFDLIPLVGATIAAVFVGVVTLFTGFPTATIVWVIWSIVYQQVENTVIQPRIQSRAVALEPFLVLVAVLFGSTLFGVLGALIAIPIAASIQIVAREYARYRDEQRGLLPPPAAVVHRPEPEPEPTSA